MGKLPATSDYRKLRDRVLATLEEGKERAKEAVELERVKTYWQVGKHIQEHILANSDRAQFGKQVIGRLATDTGMAGQRLYEMRRFYKLFPIFRPVGKLSWVHYATVLSRPTSEERAYYLKAAQEEGWSKRELQAAIRAGRYTRALGEGKVAEELGSRGAGGRSFRPRRGRLYTYRVLPPEEDEDDELSLDLGFTAKRGMEAEEQEGLKARTVVVAERLSKSPSRYALDVGPGSKQRLYTYKARVKRVTDGDTLWVELDLGFKIKLSQKLRLRGIDAPEMDTEVGRDAERFVKEQLQRVSFVVVTTARPDKYDRYLSDVFYLEGTKEAKEVAAKGRCLNQELLKEGLAIEFSGQ